MKEGNGDRVKTNFRSHPFCSSSDAAGLLGLDRLSLWQVMRGILLVFSVIGQGGLLQRQAGRCNESDTKQSNPG